MQENLEIEFGYYPHNLANRRYGTLADDLFDQNFMEIKSTAVEGAHSIYIETWKSKGVVDVESTVPKSGLLYDLWDTRQDEVNEVTNLQMFQSIVGNGNNVWNSPERWYQFRENIMLKKPTMSNQILNFSFAYLIQ